MSHFVKQKSLNRCAGLKSQRENENEIENRFLTFFFIPILFLALKNLRAFVSSRLSVKNNSRREFIQKFGSIFH
jgi:hypothetical protein